MSEMGWLRTRRADANRRYHAALKDRDETEAAASLKLVKLFDAVIDKKAEEVRQAGIEKERQRKLQEQRERLERRALGLGLKPKSWRAISSAPVDISLPAPVAEVSELPDTAGSPCIDEEYVERTAAILLGGYACVSRKKFSRRYEGFGGQER